MLVGAAWPTPGSSIVPRKSEYRMLKMLNTTMERVTVLAVRIDCITISREQSSLLIDIQRK